MRYSQLISRYLIGAVLPYFVFSWLLLSVILFVQQASRFSDIFFSINIPSQLIWQLTFALVPNVIAFTCPMAALVGVIIGLSKMQGDSELTAIRAAGVGNWQITLPIIGIGILLSFFAFCINLYGVPFAARIVRAVAMQTAIYKLESPIEPGVFNTEVAGFTIYVRDGDISSGSWKDIFIYSEDEKAGVVRLITSGKGRIDYSNELSELVLEDAVVSTINIGEQQDKFVSERVGQIRYAVKTRRGELVEKLSSAEFSPEELGLAQLSEYVGSKQGPERTEAEILWQRRITLSLTPLIFCLLGTSMVLRYKGRGRGFGIFLALLSLIVYYLLAFLGEQLARTGKISVFEGSLLPLVASFCAIVWFNFSGRLAFAGRIAGYFSDLKPKVRMRLGIARRRNLFVDLTAGLRDFDIVVNILKYYFLTLGFLGSVFVIFTAFELWKFAGAMDGGVSLLLKYLFYLLPFVYLQLSPSAAMIATLATYVIKSRQNEIVTWTSAGQSVYRLLLPCLLFMLGLGVANWQFQERVLPHSNQIQDGLRALIRSRGVAPARPTRYWAADVHRIFSFETVSHASDNEKRSDVVTDQAVHNLTIFQFADDGALQSLYRIPLADWQNGSVKFLAGGRKISVENGRLSAAVLGDGELRAETNPFAAILKKPSHLSTSEMRSRIESSESEMESRSFRVALEKRYSTLVLPFIIALFTAPFALSLNRKGKVATVGYAVALWLLFMGITSTFDQFGLNGQLSPSAAVWGPLVAFSMLGIFMMSRVKT